MRVAKEWILGVAVLGALPVLAQRGVYDGDRKPVVETVEVLAQVSAAHTASSNEETYLAREVSAKAPNEGRLVLLEDTSVGGSDPIRRSLLREHHAFRMRMVREEGCDRSAAHINLQGETSEIYRDDVIPALKERTADPEKIPCYQVEHAATRLAK